MVAGDSLASVTSSWAMSVPTIWTDALDVPRVGLRHGDGDLPLGLGRVGGGRSGFSRDQPRAAGMTPHRTRNRIRDECVMRRNLQ